MTGYRNVMMEHLVRLYTVDENTRNRISRCKTYDDLADIVRGELLQFSSRTTDACFRFRALLQHMPISYRVQLALDAFYTNYRIDKGEFFELLSDSLVRESASDKEARSAQFRDILTPHIQKNGKVTVYRGVNANSLKKSVAISYTLDPDRAKWFAERFAFLGSPEVIKKQVPPDEIMWYTNNRNENEVMVMSPYLKGLITKHS